MRKFTQKTIDVIQWLFIVVLVFMLIVQCLGYNKLKNDLVTSEEYRKENTYVRIYESQKMDKLKRENKELYDSICKLQDVESGMIIKFVERYHTGTIKADKFTLEDSLSTYHYAQDNDTVKMNIDVKARDLEWITADITIHDKFTIIINSGNQQEIKIINSMLRCNRFCISDEGFNSLGEYKINAYKLK